MIRKRLIILTVIIITLCLTTGAAQSPGRSYIYLNGSFTLRAGGYLPLPIRVTPNNRSAEVVMRFNVSREDIRVLLLDEAQYKNFQAGRTYYAVYNSGYVQNGNFNLRLTPNFYYIVFSNTEARSLNKSINAFLRVTYETGGID